MVVLNGTWITITTCEEIAQEDTINKHMCNSTCKSSTRVGWHGDLLKVHDTTRRAMARQ